MSQPYVGECRLVGFNFPVYGWSLCNGAILPIAEFDTLFNLIGTTYGGDGQQTFAVPDLQGRVPVHRGGAYVIGQRGGAETVTLNTNQIPIHSHLAMGAGQLGNSNSPAEKLPAANNANLLFLSPGAVDQSMNGAMISLAGGGQPHENMQPFLTMNWIISLYGIYPSQG